MFLIRLQNNFFITTLEIEQIDEYKGKKITFKDEYNKSFPLKNDYNLNSLYTLVFLTEDIEAQTGKNLYFGLFDKTSYNFNENENLTYSVYLSEKEESWFMDIFFNLKDGKRQENKTNKECVASNFELSRFIIQLDYKKVIQKKKVISFDGKLSKKNGLWTFTVKKTNMGKKIFTDDELKHDNNNNNILYNGIIFVNFRYRQREIERRFRITKRIQYLSRISAFLFIPFFCFISISGKRSSKLNFSLSNNKKILMYNKRYDKKFLKNLK